MCVYNSPYLIYNMLGQERKKHKNLSKSFIEKPRNFLRQINMFLKTVGTNMIYRINTRASKNIQDTLRQAKGEVVIFGQKFKGEELDEQTLCLFDSLAWFTYRKNFDDIFSSHNSSYITDANWGCTI